MRHIRLITFLLISFNLLFVNTLLKAEEPSQQMMDFNFSGYEEGGENCVLHGDDESEKLLSEIVG